MPSRAGIRELRQYLSRYIEEVKAGRTVEVTERGRVVAALVPRRDDDPVGTLRARGLLVTPARLDLASLGPTPEPPDGQAPLSEVVAEHRRLERY